MADLVAVMRDGDCSSSRPRRDLRPAGEPFVRVRRQPADERADGAVDGDDFVVGDARVALDRHESRPSAVKRQAVDDRDPPRGPRP